MGTILRQLWHPLDFNLVKFVVHLQVAVTGTPLIKEGAFGVVSIIHMVIIRIGGPVCINCTPPAAIQRAKNIRIGDLLSGIEFGSNAENKGH